jgi:hypothetical protein
MSTRFEPRRSRTGMAATPIVLVRPVDNRSDGVQDFGFDNGERQWQALVRKLRQLISVEGDPSVEADPKASNGKPTLRLLPGGRLDESEEPQRTTATRHGKWR